MFNQFIICGFKMFWSKVFWSSGPIRDFCVYDKYVVFWFHVFFVAQVSTTNGRMKQAEAKSKSQEEEKRKLVCQIELLRYTYCQIVLLRYLLPDRATQVPTAR